MTSNQANKIDKDRHESRIAEKILRLSLYFLSETKSPVLQKIIDRVAEAIQGFERFEFNRVGSDRIGFSARFDDPRGAVVAPNLSDGCLSMIGLVTLALAPGRAGVLCIEEPENGLTPKATRVFYQTIHELQNASDSAQVLISSHSPFVITEVWNGGDRDFIYQVQPEPGHRDDLEVLRRTSGNRLSQDR